LGAITSAGAPPSPRPRSAPGELERSGRQRTPQPTARHSLTTAIVEVARTATVVPFKKDGSLDHHAAGAPSLPEAVLAAGALGCSLEYLAGETAERGQPPLPDAVFDSSALTRRFSEAAVKERTLLRQLGLTLGNWRRIRNGSEPPSLGVALQLATVANTPLSSLLTT
jgi:hypothetical protein